MQNKNLWEFSKKLNTFFNDIMNKTRAKFDADLVEMNQTYRYLIDKKEECKIIGLLVLINLQ